MFNKAANREYVKPDMGDNPKLFYGRLGKIENHLWYKAAGAIISELDVSIRPWAWTFILNTCDSWNMDLEDDHNKTAMALSVIPDFTKTLACGFYDVIFAGYDMWPRDRVKTGLPAMLPRKEDKTNDLIALWRHATLGSGNAIPISLETSPMKVHAIIEEAIEDLNIASFVEAYAAGVPIEDILV